MRSIASGEDVTSMACNGCGEEAWRGEGARSTGHPITSSGRETTTAGRTAPQFPVDVL